MQGIISYLSKLRNYSFKVGFKYTLPFNFNSHFLHNTNNYFLTTDSLIYVICSIINQNVIQLILYVFCSFFFFYCLHSEQNCGKNIRSRDIKNNNYP